MRIAPPAWLAAALVPALAGCAIGYSSQGGTAGGVQTTTMSSRVSVSTNSAIGAAVIVGVMLSDSAHYYRVGPDGKTYLYAAPEPDPARRINAQDCTRPVDPEAGNLMCR